MMITKGITIANIKMGRILGQSGNTTNTVWAPAHRAEGKTVYVFSTLYSTCTFRLAHLLMYMYNLHVYIYMCVPIAMTPPSRLAVYLRRIRAAVCIQRQVRGRVARVRYQRLRCAALTTQAVFRGRHSRQVHWYTAGFLGGLRGGGGHFAP